MELISVLSKLKICSSSSEMFAVALQKHKTVICSPVPEDQCLIRSTSNFGPKLNEAFCAAGRIWWQVE